MNERFYSRDTIEDMIKERLALNTDNKIEFVLIHYPLDLDCIKGVTIKIT
ncbi:MAG: hypothetical protein PHX80_04155 [Candidatus Nanoarchaeia archaeon]|nr:hypothetical protein [Candidatus Nanoarchaeia archaeon]